MKYFYTSDDFNRFFTQVDELEQQILVEQEERRRAEERAIQEEEERRREGAARLLAEQRVREEEAARRQAEEQARQERVTPIVQIINYTEQSVLYNYNRLWKGSQFVSYVLKYTPQARAELEAAARVRAQQQAEAQVCSFYKSRTPLDVFKINLNIDGTKTLSKLYIKCFRGLQLNKGQLLPEQQKKQGENKRRKQKKQEENKCS